MEIDKCLAASTTTLVPSSKVSTTPPTAIVVTSTAALTLSAPILVNGLPPMLVGREFVRQYYTMMGKSPKNLYRFYSANSTLTFGNNPTLIGQDKIRKDIERRELCNCHAYIIKIDSQPTLGNGVVVQVIGELSNNDEPLRPFTQTFVLSPHIPKNFYVYNEIFRYQDELYPEISLETLKLPVAENQLTTTTDANQISKELSDSWIPPSEPSSVSLKTKKPLITQNENESHDPVIFVSQKSQPKNNQVTSILETLHETLPIAQPTQVKTIQWQPETPIKETIQEEYTKIKISSVANDTQSSSREHQDGKKKFTSTTELEKSKNTNELGVTSVQKWQLSSDTNNAPNTPMTYANVFKTASGLLKQFPNADASTSVNNDIKPIFIRSAIFTASTSSFVPSVNDAPSVGKATNESKDNKEMKSPKERKEERPLNFVGGNKNVACNNVVKSASFHQQRRSRRERRERYDEGLQLFLGNLPVNATAEALTPMFERYGIILELRVLSKVVQPGMRKLPNYGFLTYNCPEAVQRCLNNGPFYYPENTRNGVRLNVRPKNSDENQQARTVKQPPINNGDSADGNKTDGYVLDKTASRRLEKRRRSSHLQESGLSRGDVAIKVANREISSNNPIIDKPEESSKSLLKEDWPQLCGPASDGGGGLSTGMRRKKD